jgi:hypothetical protein
MEKGRKKDKNKRKEEKKKKKLKRNNAKLLPTAKNRTGNLQIEVAVQFLYHDVFSTYMRHFVQDDPHLLKDIIHGIINTSSSLPKRCTIGPLAQLNSMVSSWTTNGKATTAAPSLVFEDNVGEDGVFSQSTYKGNIDCLHFKSSIAHNPKILNDLKPIKDMLKKVNGGIMKEVNDLRLQIDSKKPFLALIIMAKPSILILPKFKPKMCFFSLDDIELVDWTTTNKFARLGFCEDIHHSSFLKLAMKKAIQKSPNFNLSSKLIEDDSNDEKNQFVGFVSSHNKGTLLTSFHIHSFVVFHTDLQKNTTVTCTPTSQNHMMSNMQDQLLQLMQLIQYHHVSSLSTIITNHFIGEEFNLSSNSLNSHEAMGFDVTQSTKDEEQSLFTIKTNQYLCKCMGTLSSGQNMVITFFHQVSI